jgi:hypothetical protein
MTINALCVHWWIIGDYSVGRCKKCGAIRDFEKLRLEEQARMTAIRSKRHHPTVIAGIL